MKASLQVPNFTFPGGDRAIRQSLSDIGRAAEDAGFDTIWVMDHFFQIEGMLGTADSPMLESYSTLAFLAGITERIRLGTLVTGVAYRPPGLLAKTVTTLDVLSGGRAWLGIGAAWYEREALGLGFTFPPVAERFERLEETLRIVTRMWAGDRSPIQGKHFHLAEPINSPQALSRPHPPILIGGHGEKKTFRLVAQYADACNLFSWPGPEELTRKLDVLKRRCEQAGRDYDTISKTVYVRVDPMSETAEEIVENCRSLAKIGFDHTIFNLAQDHEIEPLRRMGRDVLPVLAEV